MSARFYSVYGIELSSLAQYIDMLGWFMAFDATWRCVSANCVLRLLRHRTQLSCSPSGRAKACAA